MIHFMEQTQTDSKEIKCNWLKAWILSVEPQGLGAILTGIGTFLIGVAALIALWQGAGLLSEVLKIQQQAEKIDVAVAELRSTISILATQLKEQKANQAIESDPILNKPSPSTEEIVEALRRRFPNKPMPMQSSIYLPEAQLGQAATAIQKAEGPSEKATVLKNILKYSPKFLTTEDGNILTTEDGKPIEVQ